MLWRNSPRAAVRRGNVSVKHGVNLHSVRMWELPMKKPSKTLPFAAAFLLTLSGLAFAQTSGGAGGGSGAGAGGASSTGAGIGGSGLTGSDDGYRHGGYRNHGYRNSQSRHAWHWPHGSRYRDHRPRCKRQRGRRRRNGRTLPARPDPGRRGRDAPLPAAIGDDSYRFHRDRCAPLHHGAADSIGRAVTLLWKLAEYVLRQVTACAKLTLLTHSADSCHRHRLSSFSIPAWGA